MTVIIHTDRASYKAPPPMTGTRPRLREAISNLAATEAWKRIASIMILYKHLFEKPNKRMASHPP